MASLFVVVPKRGGMSGRECAGKGIKTCAGEGIRPPHKIARGAALVDRFFYYCMCVLVQLNFNDEICQIQHL
jgi:hypothetical protein